MSTLSLAQRSSERLRIETPMETGLAAKAGMVNISENKKTSSTTPAASWEPLTVILVSSPFLLMTSNPPV